MRGNAGKRAKFDTENTQFVKTNCIELKNTPHNLLL